MELYLLSILTHAYDIIIDSGVGVPGHGQYIVDGIDATEKCFISMLMANLKSPGVKGYGDQMEMRTDTQK